MGKAGKIIGGIDIGFFAVCIAVSSATLIIYGGWELRPYSITFCFSSLALLMYIKRLKKETNKNILLYSISLVLLLYCHWFGSILALFYAFIDLYLYFRKKISLKCFCAYILAGILFLPWLLMMIFHLARDLSSYWSRIPSVIEPIITVSWLLSGTWLYCLLFGIGFILILLRNIRRKEKETPGVSRVWLFIGIGIIWTILPIYIYSKFINPSGSFYVQRYFFVIMPHVFLITAYSFSEAFRALQRSFFITANKKKILYCMVIALFCFTFFLNYQKAYSNRNSTREPYREAAEYLSKNKHTISDDSLIISSGGSAWIEYYFNKRGFNIPANVAVSRSSTVLQFIDKGQYIQPILLPGENISKHDYLYLFEVHSFFSESFIDAIQQHYTLIEERQEFSPSMPKMNFIKQTIKNILRIRSKYDNKPPFGLRIYAKQT
jgi:hypothetical protein